MARPRLGDAPLSAAERQRRRRERRKAANRDAERSHETAQAAELERLNAELAKVTRSREYWKRRVKDDERREAYEAQEPIWKVVENIKQSKADDLGWEGFSALSEEYFEALRQKACEQYNLQPKMPLTLWRQTMQLVHPDKHNGSESAIEVTTWLLKHKPTPHPTDSHATTGA